MDEQFEPAASAVTVDVTNTTEEVIDTSEQQTNTINVDDLEFEPSEEQKEYIERNLFYANDAYLPPPPHASAEDKRKYQQIKKSVKKLRRLEKNPIFMVQMMDLKAQQKILDEMNDEG